MSTIEQPDYTVIPDCTNGSDILSIRSDKWWVEIRNHASPGDAIFPNAAGARQAAATLNQWADWADADPLLLAPEDAIQLEQALDAPAAASPALKALFDNHPIETEGTR